MLCHTRFFDSSYNVRRNPLTQLNNLLTHDSSYNVRLCDIHFPVTIGDDIRVPVTTAVIALVQRQFGLGPEHGTGIVVLLADHQPHVIPVAHFDRGGEEGRRLTNVSTRIHTRLTQRLTRSLTQPLHTPYTQPYTATYSLIQPNIPSNYSINITY